MSLASCKKSFNFETPLNGSVTRNFQACIANSLDISTKPTPLCSLIFPPLNEPYRMVRINASCTLTNTLVNLRGSEEHYKCIYVFQPILRIFYQLSPILNEIFHQKVLGACLFKQQHLLGTIWYLTRSFTIFAAFVIAFICSTADI